MVGVRTKKCIPPRMHSNIRTSWEQQQPLVRPQPFVGEEELSSSRGFTDMASCMSNSFYGYYHQMSLGYKKSHLKPSQKKWIFYFSLDWKIFEPFAEYLKLMEEINNKSEAH